MPQIEFNIIQFHNFNSLSRMYPRTRQNNRKVSDFYKQPQQSIELLTSKLVPILTQQKIETRKKDKLISKRKTKVEPLKQLTQKTQAQSSSVEQNQQLKSEQFANNSLAPERENQPSNFYEQEPSKDLYELQKIVRKPNYIKLEDNCIIKGFTGHSSVIFKRPMLQGSYYFEVKILESLEKDQDLKFDSSVRIGLCPYDYSHAIPLGGKDSVCYRSTDGDLIENKKATKFGPSFTEGDLIGVELKIGAPHKHPVKLERNEESKVSFYKNGQKVGQYQNLKQIFYTVGISLFNYAAVEVRIDQHSIQNMPEGFQPFIQNLSKEIPYKDLKSSRIFNQ